MIYYCSFDAADFTGDITITATGESNKTVTLSSFSDTDANGDASSLYCHYPIALGNVTGQDASATSFLAKHSATAFGQALVDAINVAPAWASYSFQVTYDVSAGKYTIADTNLNTFALTFANDAQRTLLGWTTNSTLSGTYTYTSDNVVDYVVLPTLGAVSEPRTNYEPPGTATASASDQGHVFTQARTAAPLYRDFLQQFELKAKMFRLHADTTHPWTFQHIYEHTRSGFPFVVSGGFGDSFDHVFNLRSEGMAFVPEPASPGDDTQFHVAFKCHVVGRQVEAGDGSWT